MFKTQQHDRNNAAPRLLVVSKRKEDQVAQDAANRQAVVMALKQQHEARPPTDATALDNNESTQKPLSPSTAAALTTILDCDSLVSDTV